MGFVAIDAVDLVLRFVRFIFVGACYVAVRPGVSLRGLDEFLEGAVAKQAGVRLITRGSFRGWRRPLGEGETANDKCQDDKGEAGRRQSDQLFKGACKLLMTHFLSFRV